MLEAVKEVICACLGAGGFALIFGLRANKVIFPAVGGGFCWAVYLLCERFLTEEILVCAIIAAAAGTAYSEIFARVLRTPATGILIPTLIPMVPGGSLYYTMSSLIASERELATAFGITTVKWAVGIAAGVTVITVITRPLKYLTHRRAKG